MTTQLAPLPVQRFYDNSGALAVGGKVYTYAAGTSTPVATYTDSTGSTPNQNPLVLNSRGEGNFWLTPGQAYKFAVYDSLNNLLWSADNIVAPGNFVSPVIGGSASNSNLVLRSTAGVGTTLPATTTDTIIFQRGNNGSQELGRYSPGGSFGVGDFSDGLPVNIHGGDDGTTTRVIACRAATAPLFVGYTNRTNAESGGPVGRSVVSFEGYRLANDTDSRESGAVRVVTEGSSVNRLGARVAILTRRDGFQDTDFNERFSISNDGNALLSGGPGSVGTPNRSAYAYGNTVFTISGQTGRAAIELTTNAADADQTILGDQSWLGNFQTDEKRIALIQGVLAGATATKRGGELRYYLKPDNGSLVETFRFTAYGQRIAGPVGTLQKAPTLTITANTIAPTASISIVGAGLIKNITVPAHFASAGGEIKIIPSAAFTTDTTGNIALASTAVVNRVMTLVYDGNAGLWYPSY